MTPLLAARATLCAMRVRAALAAPLVFTIVGCGGGQSAAEKWADSVCTDVSTWQSQVKQATDDISAKLQSPAQGVLPAIKQDVRKAVDATGQLTNDLKALGKPDTESGAQAKQQVDALASQLDAAVTKARQTLDNLPAGAGPRETATAFTPLAPELKSLATSTKSTLSSIQAAGSDMKDGFDKADSCKQFRS
jgi:hypothetical protein